MPIPIWVVIQAVLGLATGPVAIMVAQLAAMIQNQRNSNSSAQIDARYQSELMSQMRIVVARLNKLVRLSERHFQPIVVTADEPTVVDPQPFMPGVSSDDPRPRLPAASQQALQVAQQTQELSAYVRTQPIDNRTIIRLSDVETDAKYAWQAGALDDTLRGLSPADRETLRRAIPDWAAFRHVLGDATNNNEILLLPRVSGIADGQATDFYAGLSYTISRYNDLCERSGGSGPVRLRQAQKLRLASRALASDLEWTDSVAAIVHKVLHMAPTICVQIALPRRGAKPELAAWLWALGDIAPTTFKPTAPFAAARDQSDGAIYAAAQVLILLLADALSLGASEGVSVLSDLLAEHGMRDDAGPHMTQVATWYRTMHDVFDGAYGEQPIIGVPEVDLTPPARPFDPQPLINGPDAAFLGEVRGALMTAGFSVSIQGYTDNSRMFLAAQDNRAATANTCYLAIERRDGLARAWGLWRRVESEDQSAPLLERLNACALECSHMHRVMAGNVVVVAQEAWEELRNDLGELLRQQRGAG